MPKTIIVALALLCSTCIAEAQKAQPARQQASAPVDLRGTKSSPLVVETVDKPPDARGTRSTPLVVETVESPSDAAEKQASLMHRGQEATNSRYAMIFTGTAAFIALLQAGFFYWQLRYMRKTLVDTETAATATKQATELAAKEFAAAHRPRLTMRREEFRFTPEQQGINFVLANVGDTTASNITADLNHRILVRDDRSLLRESMPPYSNQQIDISAQFASAGLSPDIGAGERKFYFLVIPELNKDNVHDIMASKLTLYFFGNVTFTDSFGIRRDSAFFRAFDPVARKFIRSDDPDYEYS